MGAVSAVPPAVAASDETVAEEAWINGPVGSTVRRGVLTLLGLAAIVLNRKLGLNLDTATEGMITTLVLGYVAQSVIHSRAKVIASAPLPVPPPKGAP